MTEHEQIELLVAACGDWPVPKAYLPVFVASLEALQWSVTVRNVPACPSCRFSKARGHKCSCPIRLALRNANRVLGQGDVELEDDDLIVERAVMALLVDQDGEPYRTSVRNVVKEAVTAGIAYGQRVERTT